uniref:Uncharacterized protein n=1 Tax=Nelumbo nucifera TaxID=4432 RepID=A0A822YN05_NELNU|nr:TPA_asm: hypothetical protein HUJ06_011137 [Nelumbo nucifera]
MKSLKDQSNIRVNLITICKLERSGDEERSPALIVTSFDPVEVGSPK